MDLFHKGSKKVAIATALLLACASAGYAQDATDQQAPSDQTSQKQDRKEGPGRHRGGPGGPDGPGARHGGPRGDHRPGQGGPGGGLLGALHHSLADLGLSDDQKQQIDDMLSKARDEVRAIREEADQKIKAINDELKNNVLAQLDDTQKATLEKKLAERPHRGPGDREGGPRGDFGNPPPPPPGGPDGDLGAPPPPPPPPGGREGGPRGDRGPNAERGPRGQGMGGGLEQRINEALADQNLTDDQKAQLKTIFEEARNRGREIAEQNPEDRDARREAMRSLMEETREKVKAVLTPEQQAALEQKLQDARQRFRERGERGERGPRGDRPAPDQQ